MRAGLAIHHERSYVNPRGQMMQNKTSWVLFPGQGFPDEPSEIAFPPLLRDHEQVEVSGAERPFPAKEVLRRT